jgi:hypothetical protein
MDESRYDVAQICTNGHVANSMAKEYPNSNRAFCDQCGAPTITECPSCKAKIRGYFHVPGVVSMTRYDRPAFCHNCGKPFPWTQSALEAASEMADLLDGLSKEEKLELKKSIEELVSNSPKAEVAAMRFKKLMKKTGVEAATGMKSLMVSVLSEAIKRSLFGANS